MSALPRFRPRLLQDLKSYSGERFARDLGAGVTVGVVALPLAMAFAIASGLKPEAGLWTAIIGGLLISALGGSSVQIGGPAGAFIVVVYGIVERHGLAGLLMATTGAGLLLFLMGWLRLGNLVRFVPVSVVLGFTNGIAVLIALSQLRDALGLRIERLPAAFFEQIATLARHIGGIHPQAVMLSALCVLGLAIWPRLWASDSRFRRQLDRIDASSALRATSRIPGPVVALLTLSLLAWWLKLPVETIGSRFGGIPAGLPGLQWGGFSWAQAQQLLSPTLTLALLGAIESLLCARIADQLSGLPKHDPNQELMAQGVANAALPFLGGMPATGTIARTVTNIRSGASSPVSGIVHALTLAVIVLAAAPLAQHIPLAVLAGVLLFVAWNMGEWREFARLRQFALPYRVTFLATFVLTVVVDLTVAFELGLVLAVLFFVRRQGTLFRAERVERVPGAPGAPGGPETAAAVWQVRLHGALFFGAVDKIDALVDELADAPPGLQLWLDAQRLVSLDTSGLDALEQLHKALQSRGGALHITGLHEQPLSLIQRSGFADRLARCEPAPDKL